MLIMLYVLFGLLFVLVVYQFILSSRSRRNMEHSLEDKKGTYVACPNCSEEMPGGAKFCMKCGSKAAVEKGDQKAGGIEALRSMKNEKKSAHCSECGNVITGSARFCRHCGAPTVEKTSSSLKSFFEKLRKKKWSKSFVIITSVALLFLGTSAYAAPIAIDYYQVNKALSLAEKKMSEGDFSGVVQTVSEARNRRIVPKQDVILRNTEESAKKYLKYEELLRSAKEKEVAGEHESARAMLKEVGTDFPLYQQKVKPLVDEIQQKIEDQLKDEKKTAEDHAQAESAAKAKAQAEARASAAAAQASAAAKVRADEAAQASASAKARADEVAAQTARNAALQQQQLEAQRAEEVRKSFLAQLSSGYNSYRQATDVYYASAISYSNSGQSLLALAQVNSASAVLNSTKSSIGNLSSRFSGLPTSYYSAASNMLSAIAAYESAISLFVSSEGTSLDYSASINSYSHTGISYAEQVRIFLANAN